FSNFIEEWRIPLLRGVYERLATRLQIVQYDGRGTGHSQRDVADLSLEAMLRDLDAVAGQAGIDRFALLGFYNSCKHAVASAPFQAASGIDGPNELAAVTEATLVRHRADIEQIPRTVSEELAAALPNGHLRLLAGSSPALFFENTDEVVGAITEFVIEGRPGAGPQRSAAPPTRNTHGLTARELDVLRLIAQGETNAEIALRLTLSIHTVERHVANLYRKIDARGRADATAFAVRQGIA